MAIPIAVGAHVCYAVWVTQGGRYNKKQQKSKETLFPIMNNPESELREPNQTTIAERYENEGIEIVEELVKENKINHMKELITHNPEVLNTRWRNKRSALLHAGMCGSVDMVVLLLECGADVNAVDEDGRTLLHYAVRYNKQHRVKLCEYFCTHHPHLLSVQRDCGWNAFHTAAVWNSPDAVTTLLEHKPPLDLLIMKDNQKKTPLDYAKKYKHESVVAMYAQYIKQNK